MKNVAISFRLPPALLQRVEGMAERTDLTNTDIVRLCLLRVLEIAERDPSALLRFHDELAVGISAAAAPDRRSTLPTAAGQPFSSSSLNDSAAPDLSGAQPRRAVTYKKPRPPRGRKP